MRSGITPKQANILRYIRDYTKSEGFGPRYSDIRSYFQFKSDNSVTQYLYLLKRKGLVKKSDGAWNLVETSDCCPTCGRKLEKMEVAA